MGTPRVRNQWVTWISPSNHPFAGVSLFRWNVKLGGIYVLNGWPVCVEGSIGRLSRTTCWKDSMVQGPSQWAVVFTRLWVGLGTGLYCSVRVVRRSLACSVRFVRLSLACSVRDMGLGRSLTCSVRPGCCQLRDRLKNTLKPMKWNIFHWGGGGG